MKYLALIFLFVATTVLAREPSVYVYNETTDRIEHQRNSTEFRSIASITKLMTAMVALDHSKDLFRQLPLNTTVRSNLPRGTYTRQELFTAMLVRSDNAAAETLAGDYPGGRKEFIWRMNQQAREIGVSMLYFVIPLVWMHTTWPPPAMLAPWLGMPRATGSYVMPV